VSDGSRWVNVKWVGQHGQLLVRMLTLLEGPNLIENFEVVKQWPEFQQYENEGKIEVLGPDWEPS
jgi:hypothetical protein